MIVFKCEGEDVFRLDCFSRMIPICGGYDGEILGYSLFLIDVEKPIIVSIKDATRILEILDKIEEYSVYVS